MIARLPLPRNWPLRVALAAFLALLLWRCAVLLAGGNMLGAIAIGTLLVAPIALVTLWRYPVIFPFGLLAALVPFDALLQVGGSGANFSRFVGYLTFAAFTVYMVRTRTVLQPTRHTYLWAAYVAWAALSTVWSIDPSLTEQWLPTMAQLVAILVLCALYPIQSIEIRVIPWIIVGSGLFTALIEIVSGHSAFGQRQTLEINGVFLDPNHFSAYFMLPLGIATASFLTGRDWRVRVFSFAVVIATCFAILKCGSRGGFISIGVLLIYAAIRTRYVLAVAGIAAAGLLASLATPVVWQRFGDPTQGNAGGRGGVWAIGLHALPNYWAVGSGFGTFPDVYDRLYLSVFQGVGLGYDFPAHNLIVQSSVEVGIVGVAIVLFAWFVTIRQTHFIQRDHPLYWQRIASECMMVALFNSALTIDMLWWKYLWIAIAYAALVSNAARPRLLIAPPARALRSKEQRDRRVRANVALAPQAQLRRANR